MLRHLVRINPGRGVIRSIYRHNEQKLRKINNYLPKAFITTPKLSAAAAEHQEPKTNELNSFLQLDEEDTSLLEDSNNDSTYRTLAIIHACLRIGEMEHAYRLLTRLRNKDPQAAKRVLDIHVHNAFLNGYFTHEQGAMIRKGMEYFSKLKRFGVQPNITTFAIIIKGHIRVNKLNLMKMFYFELRKLGYDVDELKTSTHLTDKELDIFFNAIGYNDEQAVNKSVPSESLLQNDNEDNLIEESSNKNETELLTTDVYGVKLLKDSLRHAFSQSQSLHDIQIKLEETAVESATEKMRHDREARGDALLKLNLSPLRKLMVTWSKSLAQKIDNEKLRLRGEEEYSHNTKNKYGSLFCVLNSEKMALITIQSILRHYSMGDIASSSSVTNIVSTIGRFLESEYNAEQIKSKGNRFIVKEQHNTRQLFASGKLFSMAVRKAQAKIEREKIQSDWVPHWPSLIRIKMGSILLSLALEACQFQLPNSDMMVPAFSHTYENVRGTKRGVIMFDPYIVELLGKERSPTSFGARQLPMLVLPKPWLTYNSGSYYTTRQKCMRSKDAFEQMVYLKKADKMGMIHQALSSLDALGAVKWRINNKVLEHVTAVWNSGKAFADIPPAVTHPNYPPKPEDATDGAAMRQYRMAVYKVDNEIRNNHSMRCDVNYKVEIANAFKNHEFYFPHNMDFRGRAYPIPPLFNHLGNDLCRGLLTFAERKPLGERGLRWLKIQLASLAGHDKASFDERVQFAEDNIDAIRDSAEHPLDGKKWWLNAEDPWQCLAACIELTEALKLEDPTKYECSLPIHQDGTCNGLQHYAALGLDIEGARHVNLEDAEKPQDIYSGVLNLVLRKISQDSEAGIEEARALEGHVTRKVIKQTVMTNVYGVTFVGANKQILRQLENLSALNQLDLMQLSFYLTKLVFASLGELFTSAQALQAWLNECAGRIAASVPADILERQDNESQTLENSQEDGSTKAKRKSKSKPKMELPEVIRSKQMTSVIWTTPIGLTIAQPYRKGISRDIKTNLQCILIHDTDTVTPVNARKQKTAFPPNFIHSLDASHMMMTSLEMAKAGLAFASVHDSYWTHPSDVDTMNKFIREQFIELHSKPLMEDLLKEFKARYKGYKRRVTVEVGLDDKVKFSESESKLTVELPNPIESIDGDDIDIGSQTYSNNEYNDNNDNSLIKDGQSSNTTNSVKSNNPSMKGKKTMWVDLQFPPLPERGNFDIRKVLNSTYFFH